MKRITLNRKLKAAVASATLGVLMAQSLVFLTVTEVKADGSCAPKKLYVCGLNGTNYGDKYLVP